MFCPKCGQQNPETGKFCRSCGTDLGNVSNALAAQPAAKPLLDRKGKPVSWEGAITKFAMGFAFLAVSIVLGFTRMGQAWWFWMLIPAFMMMGSGVAQYVQLRKLEKGLPLYVPTDPHASLSSGSNNALPPPQTAWVSPESRYKTGDLVPPSVTDGTTRHLEIDSEGQTMTLPKK
jgi:hypothetical protein